MDDELSRPYKKIAAAEEHIERSNLLDYYVDLYKRKYKCEPIFPITAVTQTQIKDLQKIMRGKSRDIITAYFQIHDDWISRQHHDLGTLLKSLDKLNAFIVRRAPQKTDAFTALGFNFICDACSKYYYRVVKESDIGKLARCPECERQNRPAQKVALNQKLICELPEIK